MQLHLPPLSRTQWDRCCGPKSSKIETGHLFSIVKLNFNVGFVDFRAYFGPFSLVNRDWQKMVNLQRKMASNQKMQENKPTLKFNFTIEKRWPVSKFSFWHSHWALLTVLTKRCLKEECLVMKLLKRPGDHTDTSVVVGQRLFRLHPRAPSQVDHLEAGGHWARSWWWLWWRW